MEDKPKDPIGGSPPPEPVNQPSPSNELKPAFAVEELALMNVEEIEGITWLTFDVQGEFILVMKQYDYFAYLDAYYKKYKQAVDAGKSCLCNFCQPDFNILNETENKVTFFMRDDETGEEKTIENYVPMYEVYNLDMAVIVSLPEHNHEIENIIKKD